MSCLRRTAELINFKKFLFFLQLETGGVFINGYNFWLSLSSILLSFFVVKFITALVNVWLYVGSIFGHILLIVLSLVAMNGLEKISRFRICLGVIPTIVWTLTFFTMAGIGGFHKLEINQVVNKEVMTVITQLDVIGSMILFGFIHIYMLIYYVLLIMNS